MMKTNRTNKRARGGQVLRVVGFMFLVAMLRMTSISVVVEVRELSIPFANGASPLLLSSTRESDLATPIVSESTSNEPYPKNAIVTLLGNDKIDVEDMCIAVKSLLNLPDEGKSHVLVFYEQSVPLGDRAAYIQECAGSRKVIFAPLDFEDFPEGFEPMKEISVWGKRSKFGYMQMIRFFVSGLWKRPELDPYETIMRLDSDACWIAETDEFSTFLPGLADDIVYHANVEKEDSSIYCDGIFEVAEEFVRKHNITVASPTMWENFSNDYHNNVKCRPSPRNATETLCKKTPKCRTFYNNFEVVRKDFFREPMVQKWHERLADEEPFGILRKRWGDAIERYLTMAMFAKESSLQLTGRPTGYHHPCCPKNYHTIKTEHMCPKELRLKTAA